MINKQISIYIFLLCCLFGTTVFSQREVPINNEDELEQKQESLETNKLHVVNVYSIFNDFRIPVRENINTSNLRYDGWVTDPGMYTFRCRDGKRIRLTYWYLAKDTGKENKSEFINITPAMDKCQKNDTEYTKQNFRQSK